MAGLAAYRLWNKSFSKENLALLYSQKIKNRASIGIDWVTPDNFEKHLDSNIDIIIRKCLGGTYKFTRYRELLISKGADKPPRCISIPTIRDKLVFAALNQILSGVYGHSMEAPMPQTIINEIKAHLALPGYDTYIKVDIKSFYASINHDLLFKSIKKRIRKKELCAAIETTTAAPNCPKQAQQKKLGVPEGLSISNALANIYMLDIDRKYMAISSEYKYWRYVDDIIVLTTESKADSILTTLSSDLVNLTLYVNEGKTEIGNVNKGFEYLGYSISTSSTSVRQTSVANFERTLEMLFRNYSLSESHNTDYLVWKINLKITGFILDNHKYGWLFFYSQIDDLTVVAHLDWLIEKLKHRFNIDPAVRFKSFLRTYNEISKALHTTQYVPNLDNFTVEDKRRLVQDIYGENQNNLSEDQIERRFRALMKKEIRDIQKDVQPYS